MSNMVTVEIWNPGYRRSAVPLQELPVVFQEFPPTWSVGLTLDDGGDDCVIVTVETELSTVSILRDGTFCNLKISDDREDAVIAINGGEEITWPKGCILPREMGMRVLMEAADRDAVWSRHDWIEQ